MNLRSDMQKQTVEVLPPTEINKDLETGVGAPVFNFHIFVN